MLLTRAPVATIRIAASCDAPRLACVRPIASVHPEPGSNSSLYICFFVSLKQPSNDGLLLGHKSTKPYLIRIESSDPFKITPGFTIYIPV